MTIFENYYDNNRWNLKTINEAAIKEPEEFIHCAEQAFYDQIKKTVDIIESKQPECKIIMAAGPSASGKTTTAIMIRDELIKRGIWSTVISLDDFYVGIAKLPVLKDGTKDFESVNGLDIQQIRECLKGIVYENFCDMPIYDFSKMAPDTKRRQIEIPPNGVIIIEGLHALNPVIAGNIPIKSVFKIYVSVKKGVLLDDCKFISPKAIRLTRRVLRDYNYRYTLPIRTIMMWNNVCMGEQLYIRPYRKEVDACINSFHAYELCVMNKEMIELMGSIPDNVELHGFIKKLSGKLEKFQSINESLVPKTSLLKEFLK